MTIHSTSRRWALTGFAALTVAALAGCAGGNGGSTDGSTGGSDEPDKFTVLTANENQALEDQLQMLADGACAEENAAMPIEHQKTAQADTVQKVTLLASQNALPQHFIAGTDMVRPTGDLGAAGLVADYEDVLGDAFSNILPAAASTVKNVYGQMVSLPYQYNLEGIWYNKTIFDEVGIDEPQTYDELLAAADALQAAGYQPLTTAGADGWPMTRLMGMYIFRNAGPDAMAKIKDGSAKLTDPEYVAGAAALQDLATAGYFGTGFQTMDGGTSTAQFLTGKAAMKYDGSWLLSAINDDSQDEIGAENIGFMPFPAVEGGAGDINQWAANAGAAMAANAKTIGPKTEAWFSCIAENYGTQALETAGIVSGFQVNGDVADVAPATKMVQEKVADIDETVLWFEALFDAKTNSLASTNGSLLVSGDMSPEDYMTALQSSIDAAQ
ncbi:ABC transporter substrate-binding protein [Microbacterium sorbitolivorans]|uniref:Extracellular solute-binding protein n=1 Tax=Microbacterium sorbitolivorans TaxID=1867410 RepID=A0A367XXE1_9MICO|nr:extracellular solute-binding protein [Microbacterium sorbitolivorans]RCK58276.1 extracellular solute-binding protein [Microbacterium sorbitolivorans]GGF38953.1 ABC transporter substrate-binding protein [Microbacterium sorbitolivorans]